MNSVRSVLTGLTSKAPLPGVFPDLLREGQLFTALILSTSYSEKYGGKELREKAVAEVKLPNDLGVWQPTLVGRFGYREATPFIWLGDSAGSDAPNRDDTLYVAFGPLRNKRQFLRILTQGSRLLPDVVRRASLSASDDTGTAQALQISAYVKEKLDHLWGTRPPYDFGTKLAEAAARYPGLRIIFCGISHGAALAQAAALRFALTEPAHRSRVHVIAWNAYKWTDEAGSALASRILGPRSLPLVLTSTNNAHGRRWDSVPEYPPGFSPMPGSMLLEGNSGIFFGNLQLREANLSIEFVSRGLELHFAKGAISGMKKAMEVQGTTGRRGLDRWRQARSKIRIVRILSSGAGSHGPRLIEPGDEEVADDKSSPIHHATHDDAQDGESGDEGENGHVTKYYSDAQQAWLDCTVIGFDAEGGLRVRADGAEKTVPKEKLTTHLKQQSGQEEKLSTHLEVGQQNGHVL